MRTDGQTDTGRRAEANNRFSQFCVNEDYYVWHVTLCSSTDGTDVSEEHVTTFFGVEK
jgi:hypothetical protein